MLNQIEASVAAKVSHSSRIYFIPTLTNDWSNSLAYNSNLYLNMMWILWLFKEQLALSTEVWFNLHKLMTLMLHI